MPRQAELGADAGQRRCMRRRLVGYIRLTSRSVSATCKEAPQPSRSYPSNTSAALSFTGNTPEPDTIVETGITHGQLLTSPFRIIEVNGWWTEAGQYASFDHRATVSQY